LAATLSGTTLSFAAATWACARAEEVKTSARSSPSVAVGALATEKRLFRNTPPDCLVGALFEKKFCDINERLNPF